MPRTKHSRFPDPGDYDDILALGGALTIEYLVDAYEHGIFPWPMDESEEIPWFCPKKRAVLFFEDLHIPTSLKKIQKKKPFRLSVDEAFREVIHACAGVKRPGQAGTWITSEVLSGYTELHRIGRAHSVEAWITENGKEKLVGGIYGVDGGGIFAAESMFFTENYASKLALLHLIEHLKSRGLEWLDIQMLTPHMKALGAREISREKFLKLLKTTQTKNLALFS